MENSPTPPTTSKPWLRVLLVWLAIACGVGLLGTWVAVHFGIPGYLGGLFAFVLTGMCGMFSMAAWAARR